MFPNIWPIHILPSSHAQARRSSEYSDDFDSEPEEAWTSADKKQKPKNKRSGSKNGDEDTDKDGDDDDDDVAVFEFVAKRWFAKDEDDGEIVRELVPTNADGGVDKV